jgi:hypothetical protein
LEGEFPESIFPEGTVAQKEPVKFSLAKTRRFAWHPFLGCAAK